MAHWYAIEPRTKPREHIWSFAVCIEAPSEREDEQWWEALYFRNADRTQFGKIEIFGTKLSGTDFRSVATKIVKDKTYRERYVSEDPELPKLWRKR